jgi:hypothetical protein
LVIKVRHQKEIEFYRVVTRLDYFGVFSAVSLLPIRLLLPFDSTFGDVHDGRREWEGPYLAIGIDGVVETTWAEAEAVGVVVGVVVLVVDVDVDVAAAAAGPAFALREIEIRMAMEKDTLDPSREQWNLHFDFFEETM